MLLFSKNKSLQWFSFLLLIKIGLAIELVPVRPSRLARRDLTSLNLRNTESFLWENQESEDAVIANFTVLATGAQENVLSMEKFDGLLTSVFCSPRKLVLVFEDKEAFTYAQRVWDWVNGEDDNSFVMIAGVGDCGDNTARIPYQVRTIRYDPAKFKATLAVTTGKWKDIVRSYDFHVESRVSGSGVTRRGEVNGGKGIDLNRAFPVSFKVQSGPLIVQVECAECKTTGNIGYSFDIKQNIVGWPNQAILTIDPKGVAAIAKLKLTVEGEFKKLEVEKLERTILSIPLNGWSINNIFEIGPYLDFVTGVEVTGFKGAITVTGGATVSLSDEAHLEADLLHLTRNPVVRGWSPIFDALPVNVSASVAAQVQFFLTPKLRLKAEGLNVIGVQTGVEIKSIPLEAKLEATVDTGGVCENPKKHFGVSATYSTGFEVKWTAGKSPDGAKPAIEYTFGHKYYELPWKTCIGCDDNLGNGCQIIVPPKEPIGTWVDPPKPKPTATAKKPAPTGYGKCKNSPGECMTTTKCRNTGGVSKAGFCPGPNNIQCCNYPKGSGDYCTAGGINGICKPTSNCKSGGGSSIPGHCAGPKDIQCCVPKAKEKPATNKNICTISKAGLKTSGFVGECISTSACRGGKGTSTPGFCPGSANIQCCTYGTCANGVAGVCEPVSSCTGTPLKGLCGGGNSIQCCTHPEWKPKAGGI